MIQRIQTLYLIVSLGLIVLVFFLPVSELIAPDNQLITFRATGFYYEGTGKIILPTIPVIIILAVILLLYIICIFLYKRRLVQMRLCVINLILLVGLTGLFVYHLLFFVKTVQSIDSNIGISFILPVIAIILTYLAFRGIRKDEYLVKLADRIR